MEGNNPVAGMSERVREMRQMDSNSGVSSDTLYCTGIVTALLRRAGAETADAGLVVGPSFLIPFMALQK